MHFGQIHFYVKTSQPKLGAKNDCCGLDTASNSATHRKVIHSPSSLLIPLQQDGKKNQDKKIKPCELRTV